MTREEKIKVLAELDGYECCCKDGKWDETHGDFGCPVHGDSVAYYLTSYDAIIPLIQKQPKEIRLKMFEEKSDRVSIMTTPEQLADALIKAVGKWKD